jgi:flagellar biosynthesis GTPase FlhF
MESDLLLFSFLVFSKNSNLSSKYDFLFLHFYRLLKKRIKLATPEVTPISKTLSGSKSEYKTTPMQTTPVSTSRNKTRRNEIRKVSESCSEASNSNSTSTPSQKSQSQEEPDNTRRRSSRIQKILIQKEEEAAKFAETPPAPTPKKHKRRRRKSIASDPDSDSSVRIEGENGIIHLSSSSSSDNSTDSEDEFFVESKKKKKKKNSRIAPIFLKGKDREKELQRLKEEKEPKKVISQATLDFLRSGVPDAIVKVQKAIEKKKEEADLTETLELFPTFTHNVHIDNEIQIPDFSQSSFPIKESIVEEELVTKIGLPTPFESELCVGVTSGSFCCGPDLDFSPAFLTVMENETRDDPEIDPLPWIEKYRVQRRSELVIDKEAHRKFEKWLKQWRSDITDDGGTSRKSEKRRKRRDSSDSDFVTDEEEEEEYKKKSVLLTGATGSGKTTMVYVLARQIGFKVRGE